MLRSFEEKQQEFKETNYFHCGATALAILILYYYSSILVISWQASYVGRTLVSERLIKILHCRCKIELSSRYFLKPTRCYHNIYLR